MFVRQATSISKNAVVVLIRGEMNIKQVVQNSTMRTFMGK